MASQALIQLFQASSQPIQAPNWLSGLTSALLDLNSAQTDRRMDERTDERKSPCVLQDFVPFGAAALLPLNLNHTLLKQGTGTADHLLPLGCYFPSGWDLMDCVGEWSGIKWR